MNTDQVLKLGEVEIVLESHVFIKRKTLNISV